MSALFIREMALSRRNYYIALVMPQDIDKVWADAHGEGAL